MKLLHFVEEPSKGHLIKAWTERMKENPSWDYSDRIEKLCTETGTTITDYISEQEYKVATRKARLATVKILAEWFQRGDTRCSQRLNSYLKILDITPKEAGIQGKRLISFHNMFS